MATYEKLPSGNYRITVSMKYDNDGKQHRARMVWQPEPEKTEKQTQKQLTRVMVDFENRVLSGEYSDSKNMRLDDFCVEYLALTKTALAPRTWTSYKNTIESRIIPALGHIKLSDLRPLHVQRFIKMLEEPGQYEDIHYKQWQKRAAAMQTKGKPIPPEPKKQIYLSATTIQRIHSVLQSILARALKLGLISSNPASTAKIDMPKVQQAEVQMLDENAANAVLQALESEPIKYQVMIHLALTLGCRRGELMALTWQSIDFQTNTVTINHSAYKLTGQPIAIKEPKNKSSIRKIAVPQYCIELLKTYRKEQAEYRLSIGNQWQDESNWIFTQFDGHIMNPDTPSSWFPKFLKAHGLPHVKFHALRHSSATLLLYSGANIKEVASRLGQTQLSTTSRYLHALQPADQAAANTFDSMFGNKAEKKSGQA
jgi:integrase